tara:strand:- start:1832 stop:1948 length:117 start_codon:yes stop_codon:yes gene_type:complete
MGLKPRKEGEAKRIATYIILIIYGIVILIVYLLNKLFS